MGKAVRFGWKGDIMGTWGSDNPQLDVLFLPCLALGS